MASVTSDHPKEPRPRSGAVLLPAGSLLPIPAHEQALTAAHLRAIHRGQWQDPHTGLERRQAQVELEELGLYEQRAEPARTYRAPTDEVAAREAAACGSSRGRASGACSGASQATNRASHSQSGEADAEHAGRAPSRGASMIAQRIRPSAAIESAPPSGSGSRRLRVAALRHQQHGPRRSPRGDDRHVDEEHRIPTRNGRAAARRRSGRSRSPGQLVPAHRPIARARSWGSRKRSLINDSVAGIVRAAPLPITAPARRSGWRPSSRTRPPPSRRRRSSSR